MQVGAEDSAAHCWTAYAWSYDGDVMNGPDDLTKRPPDGDGESWALPAPETPATSAPNAAPAPASAPAPSSAPRRGRSRFGTALLAVVVGASVVVGSAAIAFVAFSSGPDEDAAPPAPSASATAAPADDTPGTGEPGPADDPNPTRGAAPAPDADSNPDANPDVNADANPDQSADAPDDANAADLNLGGIGDCSMGPDTWRIISGDVGCPEATDVGIRYLSARDRGLGEGEGAYVYIDDWACSSPSAARSAELGAVAVCTRADGARVHQLP